MKKTLVAVAAIAAVTGAMADATISGVIDQAYYTSKSTNSAGASTSSKGIGSQNNGTSEFTISGKEDLGNGMNASFALNVQADLAGANAPAVSANSAANGIAMRRSFIGLGGDFGSVKLGNQWTPVFFTVLAADPTALVSTTGAGLVGAGYAVGANTNSITYALPTLVPGLAISLQKGQGDEAAGATASSAGANTGGSVTYASGALMASYAFQKATANGTTFGTGTGISVATLTSGTSKVSSSATAVTYDLGMAKASVLLSSDKVTGTTAKVSGSAYGVSIPVTGATTLGLIMSSTSNTSATGTATKEKGSRYAVFHALSKRTTAYAFMGKSSQNGTSTAISMTAFGLQHGF